VDHTVQYYPSDPEFRRKAAEAYDLSVYLSQKQIFFWSIVWSTERFGKGSRSKIASRSIILLGLGTELKIIIEITWTIVSNDTDGIIHLFCQCPYWLIVAALLMIYN